MRHVRCTDAAKMVADWPRYLEPTAAVYRALPYASTIQTPSEDRLCHDRICSPLLGWTYGRILDFRFGALERSPELMFVDLCSIFQAGAVRNGPEPNFGRKPAQNRPKLKSIF